MKEEYDFSSARKNPYIGDKEKQDPLKQLVSADVIKHMDENGLYFSDMEIATIIFQSNLTKPERLRRLSKLEQMTGNTDLRRQIRERIAYERLRYQRFTENDGNHFYQVVKRNGNNSSYPTGHFASVELALAYAKQLGTPFEINKYRIRQENSTTQSFNIDPEQCLAHPLMRPWYASDTISQCSYDAEGNIENWWSYKTSEEDQTKGWGPQRFEWRFIEFPNPFEANDIVRDIRNDNIGIVVTSQEKWREFLQLTKERDLGVDFGDASITINFVDEDGWIFHEHIQPIYLEKVTEADDDTRTRLHWLMEE